MTNKQIKLLAQKSFTRGKLDALKVRLFSGKMRRKDLRGYIRELRIIDLKTKVKILVPDLKTFKKNSISSLLREYKGKKIIYEEDPALLLGIKIEANDLIYDYNLKNSLENVVEKVENL